jgi:ParB family transcriptional regulator, chromosome partitioning protein
LPLNVSQQVLTIPLAELMPDPSQPRKTFLDEEVSRLAASIAARGVLQPLRVIRDEQRQVWVILTGESRYRAAKLAGLQSVPCLPVAGELSEVEKLADRLTENDVRHDLQPMEAARALARLKALKGCNSKTLVEEYGFSGAAISKAEALLSLPADLQELVGSGPGQIAPASAYELSRLPDEHSQRELAQAVVAKHMPRDAVADAVRGRVGKRNVAPKAGRLSCKLDGGITVTVNSGEPLTWDDLLTALDHLKKQAKKLCDDGKEVSALARVLRAS